MVYTNPIIGRWCEDAGHPGHVWGIGKPFLLDEVGNPVLDEAGNAVIDEDALEQFEVRGWDWGPLPTEEELVAYNPAPVQNPVTDVEIMTPVFIDYRRQATLGLDGLKAQVWSYLKNDQEMDPAAATAAGVAFCKSSTGIGVQYDDFIKAGGHPDAAADLWARIQEIKGNFAWFDAGVEALFAAFLGVTP